MSEFSVSLPDLRGLEKQVEGCGDTYKDLWDAFNPDEFTNNSSNVLGVIHSISQDSPLAGGLSLFSKELMAYIEATREVCERLTKGFGKTTEKLGGTIEEYKEREEKALKELASADPDSDEARKAQKTADSIDHGDANSDWSEDVSAASYLPKEYSPFDYRTRSSSHYDEKTDLERILDAASDLSVAGTADAILEWIIGYSPTTQWAAPFAVGDWGFLWYMRDYFNGAADTADELRELLDKGSDTLLAGDWTGPAAEAYADHADKGWGETLKAHSDNLRDAANLCHETGNKIEETGATISPLITMMFDIAIDLITRNPSKLIKALKEVPSTIVQEILTLVAEGELKIEDLLTFLEGATQSTNDLVTQALDIEAPHYK